MTMKYVCFKTEYGAEEILMFPKSIHHDCFAEMAEGIRNQSYGNWERIHRTPISAGFVLFHKGKATCYGKSETLSLASRPSDDSALLNKQLEG